jgi:hypothetical protein
VSFKAYAAQHPDLADQLNRMQKRVLPDNWDADIRPSPPTTKAWPDESLRARC